ncbi:helix-turn-helix protein [Rhodobacter sp. JA431]|uniref:helix-turn-helix domain-containing protein n=1 Tax=Rhodobacter sp. JA431 TaxID=570013 RepID=UPI000BD03445|nr:helix-turn-helix domain-containing protein [Rhodobacter sp. JA431]SOC11351.1 helix-turn-helix protein [Rhodobacter sp. JA431]
MTKHDRQPLRPLWVRVSDVGLWFGVSRATVYRAAARGEITIYKQRGSRVRSDEMDRWLSGECEPTAN